MNSTSNVYTAPNTFRNSSARPIQFDRLHPGSLFRIVAEPSRGIRRSKDSSIYQKARDGYYSENLSNKQAIVLYPEDLVMPVIRVRTPKS